MRFRDPVNHGSKDVGGIKSVTNVPKEKPKAINMPSIFSTLVEYCVQMVQSYKVLLDFSLPVKAVPHECVIRTSQT